jgi:hypothetical protein
MEVLVAETPEVPRLLRVFGFWIRGILVWKGAFEASILVLKQEYLL